MGPLPSEGTKLTLGYWKIRGLAAPVRMMCMAAGVPLEFKGYELLDKPDGGYDGSAWFAEDKPPLAKINPLMNLPYLIDGNILMTQSQPIYLYLADKCDMAGKTPEEKINVQQTLAQVYDLRNALIDIVYGPLADFESKWESYLDSRAQSHFAKLEAWLETTGTPFLAGPKPTVADFHCWEMVDIHDLFAKEKGKPSVLSKCPKLAAIHAAIKALPELAPYWSDEGGYKLAINNKMAHFK
uniref:glutathione transferase n=1 Tax=Hemiselmis tepida TaxID=464990 RepID=A0A7S0YJZ5_9CRYP|mmetsp:Transcript_12665/g.32630  ORF Transcript_12665/g.32630 Transcript_12665/m.32630 type:complete len:240 (+) Transcript_12665:36-755(+)|eukprot:CAMPEP_0174924314 /NCGR_PEP_ID=MMETSP1355-20121228/7164_1 /TAXON_ID=464990 /ORGANISM="Hemiselmis tepida, Strain CCMP443" /LENGTH=239 /DNA_ID=CAMNT_0016170099 /DNA_START=47 /DNA_END=766 /DNA_ORIENTATION=+